MSDLSAADRTARTRMWLLGVIALVVGGWALHATAPFLVPVVFSVFMALLVAPLDGWVSKRVPDRLHWLGHLVAMGAIFVTLLAFLGLIWIAAQQVVDKFPMPDDGSLLPDFGGALQDAPDEAASGDAATTPEATESPPAEDGDQPSGESEGGDLVAQGQEAIEQAGNSLLGSVGDWASGVAMQVLRTTGTTLGAAVLSIFLTLIMLIEAPTWRDKLVSALDPTGREAALESVGIISKRLRWYLLARTVLGLATAALYALWLWIFGIDLLVVWALLVFVLNYIPTLGSLIGGLLPVAYAFVQKDLGTAFAVGAGLLVIEQVMGNYVDPRVQGRQLSLSSLVVLIALLVWGWMWGIAGTILAVPVTISVMIVCAHLRPLKPFALMLSDATDIPGLERQTHEPKE